MENQEEILDLGLIFKLIKKKWWLILALALSLMIIGYAGAKLMYVPQYTSTATFVVSNKNSQTSQTNGDQISSSDLSASSTLANTFKYILLSDEALTATKTEYSLNYTLEQLKNCFKITPVTGTNILEMSVTTDDAALSKKIADNIIEYYPEVLSRTLKTASLEILNSPSMAELPDQYDKEIIYPLVGLIAGLFISFAIIVLQERFNDRLMTSSDITSKLDLNVMVTVPQLAKKKKKKGASQGLLITNEHNGFIFIETYKALRTKVENISVRKGYKSFVVSSAAENEGKTTVAANLALALSQNGKKVLLIDADLRKPSVYKLLDILPDKDMFGLHEVLDGKTSVDSVLLKFDNSNLHVLPSYESVSNSSELLSSLAMKTLLENASRAYDFIIIDTAPAGLVTDAAVLTTMSDGAILVIRQDFSSASQIDKVVENLSENTAELIGSVFNNVESEDGLYSGYKRYGKYGKSGRYGVYGKNYTEKQLLNEK